MIRELEDVEVIKVRRNGLARVVFEKEWALNATSDSHIKEVAITLEHYFVQRADTKQTDDEFEYSLPDHIGL